MLKLIEQLSKLNELHAFRWDEDENCIYTDCNPEYIIVPEGWYVRKLDNDGYAEITNKHNTNGKSYESYTLYQYGYR